MALSFYSAVLFVLFFISGCSQAPTTDLCILLKLENCGSTGRNSRRSSAQSMPSMGSAAQFNPANVTHDRGIGAEVMYQVDQTPTVNMVTGTGRAGAALVSPKLENTFFSNRIPELEEEYLTRRRKNDQYESKKYALATSKSLKKSEKFSFDLGLLAKYHPDVHHVHPGAGFSMRVGIFNLGYSLYKDSMFLELKNKYSYSKLDYYDILYNADTYHETFLVHNYMLGMRIKSLFLDYGYIRTNYKFYKSDQSIKIYSASLIYKSFLLNAAFREEKSPHREYEQGELVSKEIKRETYGGIQYSFKKAVILGLHYNYYLMGEYATSLTLFF
jgi:hypothetical protein